MVPVAVLGVVQVVALAVALTVALVVVLEVVVQVAARAVAPEVVARVAVVHPVVEIGEVINTIVVETHVDMVITMHHLQQQQQ